MHRRNHLAAAAFALGVAAVNVLTGSAARAGGTPDPAGVERAAYRALARARGTAAFGGLYLTEPLDAVHVTVTSDDASVRARIVGDDDAGVFQFSVVPRSYAALVALRDRIRDDRAGLAAAGVELAFWGPSARTNTVMIAVTHDTAEVRAQLEATYGRANITVSQHARITPFATRLNDVAPWNGGDFIANDGGVDCSSGPPVYAPSTGKTYLLTAGHCFSLGNRILNGSYFMTGDNPRVMGYVTRDETNSGYDVALIDTSSSTRDFRSQGANDTGSAYQYSSQTSVEGAPVCASGAPSGERCATVVATDLDGVNFDGNLLNNLNYARRPGVAIAGEGDSGGPMYSVQTGGNLLVQGTIVGGDTGSYPLLMCPQNDQAHRGVACTDNVFYHDITSVLLHLNVALKT